MKYQNDGKLPHVFWSSLYQQCSESDCACPGAGLPIICSQPCKTVESDCACPAEGSFSGAVPEVTTIPYQRPSLLHRAPLPGAHEVAFNPDRPAGIAVLNQPARRILDTFARPQTAFQAADRLPDIAPSQVVRTANQLAALGLLISGPLPQHATRNTSHVLTAWLHIADACNLRCAYCYLHRSGEVMDEATGKAAVGAVFRSAQAHGFQAIKLKYAGGEPTLNFDLVRTLHTHAQALASTGGLELSEVLLTNGVALTPDILCFIRDAGMRLSISLDGIGETHDVQRAFANGRGSFDLVEQSIGRALALGIRPYLSITVTARNVDMLADVVAFALERELLFNLNFYRPVDPTMRWDDLPTEDDRLIAGMRRAFSVIEKRLPDYPLIGGLVDRAHFNAPHSYACGAGRNYLVIDQRGRVARCQMEIGHPVTTVLAEDPLRTIRQHGDGFRNVGVEERIDCRECIWRYWCGGGCPLLAHRLTGRNDVPSPYCRVYQALYPDMIRLEGLRLLKWH